MTSSNVGPTDEGQVAVAKPSPPPDLSASAALPTDANAPGNAAATTAIAVNAEFKTNQVAPANITPMKTVDAASVDKPVQTQTQTQPFSLDDLPGNQLSSKPAMNEAGTDIPIPSPPTVSPLSTPAATNVNLDEVPDEVLSKLAPDLPPLAFSRDPTFRTGIFGPQQSNNAKATSMPEAMDIDDPYLPEETNFPKRSQLQAIATTDPDPHGAEYSHGLLRGMRLSQGSIDPSAYMMNIATQATIFQDHGPPVIDPSAVSLQSLNQDSEAFSGSAGPASLNECQQLESFAKIEFADSTFQMTTYAVIIGRDQQAMAQARADEKREANYRRRCEENERNGLPPPTPVMYDRGKFSKSYVSEEGGMLGPEHSDGEDVKPVRRRRQSSVAQIPTGDDNASGDHVQSNRQYVSHTPGAAAVDMSALQPSPGHIPFIGIHSPGPDIASKTRGISRQHLKIQFNKQRGVFEGIALHKNGFFCEDILYGLDNPATLRSGDRLQIKDVEFFFIINGVQIGMSGGEEEDVKSTKRMSVGGKEMSLDFEHSDHENFRDTSDELSDVENIPTPNIESDHSDGEMETAPVPPSASVEELRQKAGLDTAVTQPVAREGQESHENIQTEIDMPADMPVDMPPEFAIPDIPKRRGPGRPPKDGIMSKRERRLLKKQMQETSKKALPQDPQEEKIKRPVGRPRKNPLPEDGEQPEKRKYNKKKREDGEGGSDVEKRIKEKKDKKVRPKSPPLELRREDYTAEQLQKPTKNYGVLIDEALTNGPPDGLTLKQIYKRITAKYPWFFFTAETKGWESSVRHNLIGNEAFKKDEETGLWSRVPGVELDAGKKRKVNSPDRHLGPSHLHPHLSHSAYYQSSPYANAGSVTYTHGLPSYSTEQKHLQPGYSTSLGQSSQLHAPATQPVTQPVYTAHVPAPAQLPAGYGNLGIQRPTNTSQQSTYSSPYARPPPPAIPPSKPDSSLGNTQTSVASSTTQAASTSQQQQPKPAVVNTGAREQLSADIERAIVQFSANMLEVIAEKTPHAASIIEAAANRIRGLPVQNRVPGFEPVETTLVNAMQGMIRDMKRSHQNTVSAPPPPVAPVQPAPTPPTTVEAEIQRRLKNFRESMVAALRTKTDKAELVVDSAINRACGQPHAGKIPGWEEADNLMVKSVTQIIAEARAAYNLKVQNTPPTATSNNRIAPSQPVQPVHRSQPPASPAPALTTASTGAPASSVNGIPATPYSASSHPPLSGVVNSSTLSMARPGMPLQRPAPVALTRPLTTSSMARPTTGLQKEPTTTPAMASAVTAPTAPRPNVSSPAPPSAGVLDQITGHRRFTDDSLHKNHNVNNIPSSSHTSGNLTASSNIMSNSGVGTANSSSVTNPAPSTTMPSSIAGPMVGREGTPAVTTTAGSGSNGPIEKPSSLMPSIVTSKPAITALSNTASIPVSSAPSSTATTTIPVSGAPSNTTAIRMTSTPSIAATIPVSGPARSNIATLPMSGTPSSSTAMPVSSIPGKIAATPVSSVPGNIPRIPVSSAPINTPSIPVNSAPINTPSIPVSSAPNITPSFLGSTAPRSVAGLSASIPASSAPSNFASIPTTTRAPSSTVSIPASGISNNTINPAATSAAITTTNTSAIGSRIGAISNPTVVSTATLSTPSHVGGGTARPIAHSTASSTAQITGKTNTPACATASIVNQAPAVASSNSMAGALGTPVSLTPAQILGSIRNSDKGVASVATGSTSSPGIGAPAPVGRIVGDQVNRNIGQNVVAKVETEKSTVVNPAAAEHHEPTTFKPPVPTHNASGPAPPSAGVVDQIAGHKRSIDEGPGSTNGDQPEPKRLGLSTT